MEKWIEYPSACYKILYRTEENTEQSYHLMSIKQTNIEKLVLFRHILRGFTSNILLFEIEEINDKDVQVCEQVEGHHYMFFSLKKH